MSGREIEVSEQRDHGGISAQGWVRFLFYFLQEHAEAGLKD